MRVPTVERRPFRFRGWIITALVVVVVLLFSLRGLAGFYTDFLWFDSLEHGETWSALLSAKVVPALVFTVAFFALLYVNLWLADRIAPRIRISGTTTPEDELVARYRQSTERYAGRIRIGVAAVFALVAGVGVASRWNEWILFTNRVDFGRTDAQFDRDIGFYVFQLPFINFIVDWLFAGLVLVLIVTAVAHYLNGGIRFQSPHQRATPQVKAHLSVILALMALVKTADYYFARFDLLFSNRGAVDGATYTDIKAQLPAYNLLIIVSIMAAGLFIWNIRRRGWVLPVIAAGLWAFLSIVVGAVYPAAIQNFKVEPNEYASERPYLARNIEATRDAFGLSAVEEQEFEFNANVEASVVDANLATIQNARLWDPDVIDETYQTMQGFVSYYRINDVDVDRYTVDGQVMPVLIATRDLNSSELPSQSWVNEHLVYTHGYGAVASPANLVSADNTPVYYLSDIPARGGPLQLSEEGAQVYFGEGLDNYVIVGTKQAELNFPRSGQNDAQTRYRGADGVELSNLIRRAAFALRFGDLNPLISGQVTSESKVLLERDVRRRAQKLAPFLRFDADPYPVVIDGRIVWVLDGYTTSQRYPYAQAESGTGGLSGSSNYVRNSVKATIDGYDGTVTFYVVDEKDPVVQAYRQAFPDLFEDQSAMPDGVRQHLRYPQDLFKLQSEVYARYHVTDTRRFYRDNARWLLSPDPAAAVAPVTTATTRANRSGQQSTGRSVAIRATSARQDPYYLDIRVPGDDRESFVLLQPFVPVSEDNKQTRLVSFLTAKGDPRDYGKLQSFTMPQQQSVQGPVQVAAAINADTTISEQITLLTRGGSQISYGTVQLIPVGRSIVYVQPIFISSTVGQPFPRFSFVAVYTQGRDPVLALNVRDGLNLLFGRPVSAAPSTVPGSSTPQTFAQLLAQAVVKFNEAETALRAGDLATYQARIREAEELVRQAQQVSG